MSTTRKNAPAQKACPWETGELGQSEEHVRVATDQFLNAYGEPYHPTDSLIWWGEKEKERIRLRDELRSAWDSLTKDNTDKNAINALKMLLSASYERGYTECGCE